jgi:hypothetical protein
VGRGVPLAEIGDLPAAVNSGDCDSLNEEFEL